MTSVQPTSDDFESGFQRIETLRPESVPHIRYRLTDAELAKRYATDADVVVDDNLLAHRPYGGEAADPDANVTLADIYTALGITDDEHVSICHKPIGGLFRCDGIYTPATAVAAAYELTGDVWFGLNPLDLEIRKGGGRGGEADVTRVVGLPADLDVKDDGCPDLVTAQAIIDDVSAVLGARPVVMISSEHGLQPIWKVQDCTRDDGRVLVRRFGTLVKLIAKERNAAVDNVFELARILRVPGTTNYKHDVPAPTRAVLDIGKPMTVAHINHRLDEAGVYSGGLDLARLGNGWRPDCVRSRPRREQLALIKASSRIDPGFGNRPDFYQASAHVGRGSWRGLRRVRLAEARRRSGCGCRLGT